MLEKEFEQFLLSDPKLTGVNGVPFRMSKGRKAEGILGKQFDEIVLDDDTTYDALMQLRPLEDPAHNPMQNVLRKYYVFKNSKEFPRLKNYER